MFHRFLAILRKTGGSVIFPDLKSGEYYVIMPLHEYEAILEQKGLKSSGEKITLKNLTEERGASKMRPNQNSVKKRSFQNQPLREEMFEALSEEDNEDEQYYFEPLDESR